MRRNAILFALVAAIALISSTIIVQAPANPYWLDTSWHFRANFTINNSNYARDNWSVEQGINFTALMSQAGKNGTFDIASIRAVEQNSTGGVLYQIKYQFENGSNFDAANNAAGNLVFLLNGTTAAGQLRYIYVYFDIIENGAKSPASFTTNLKYSWNGEEAHVNNSILKARIDTLRGENTSGLYEVRAAGNNLIFTTASASGKTKEYAQYSNGTHNFSFDFRNNAAFRNGSIRLVIEQNGNETFWNAPDSKTGFGQMRKRYTFYETENWIKIEQNFTNMGSSAITRNSTFGGALSINGLTTSDFFSMPWSGLQINGSETNPASWFGAFPGGFGIGLINLNYSGNANYSAVNSSGLDRLGINLESVTLQPGESITETAAIQFEGVDYWQSVLMDLRNRLIYTPAIISGGAQYIPASIAARTGNATYNRNESALITGNTTSDAYGIISLMNATIDMGTPGTSDDTKIMLYDDGSSSHGDAAAGDGIFSNLFGISNNSATGMWNITINAYDAGSVLINQNSTLFNVTDLYNVSLNITNPIGYVNRLINATISLKNARKDIFIGGADLNCSYGAGQLTNITDFSNGTYLLNFTAPSATGNYILNCSASKFNNSGREAKQFTTQKSETVLLLNISPENHTSAGITVSLGDSFNITANATEKGDAGATAANISLYLPNNLSAVPSIAECGDIGLGGYCTEQFNITVSNKTAPGNYTLNISVLWTNPIGSKNTTNTSFAVYVISNPRIDAIPAALAAIIAEGATDKIGNITVRSAGNDNITNITFNVAGLDDFIAGFNPGNISSIPAGELRNISVNVSVPVNYAPGTYNGTINVSSGNGGWLIIGLNITVPSSTYMTMQKSPQNYTSPNISVASGDYFILLVNSTDAGIANAKNVNITLSLPERLVPNASIELCGNINISQWCAKAFNITILNQTVPGNYTFNITTKWRNPDSSVNSTTTNFTARVLSNPILNASEIGLATILPDNSSITAGNFTVYSIGNDNLTNVTFNITGLSNFTITFSPGNISSLGANGNQTVVVNVSAPLIYPPGNYTGTINISSINGGWKSLPLNVSVLVRREWNLSTSQCLRAENPETGIVCNISVINYGNAPINFTIVPYSTNYTYANTTNFTVERNSSNRVAFFYNVTNITKAYYFENYTINATNSDASPPYAGFQITLIPYVMPLFSISLGANESEQGGSIGISVNVTDRSTMGINWTIMNITLPNGTVETYDMVLLAVNGSVSRWYYNYSGNMSAFANYSANISNYTGNTMQRGLYNFKIFSADNTGVVGEANSSFKAYAKLLVGFLPGSTKYFQGSKWSLYYSLTDAAGVGLEGANATITLKDPLGNMSYEPYFQKFTTAANGQILPVPEFSLPNDAKIGNYNITANMTYYDALANKTLTSFKNASFSVQAGSSGGGGGLTAEVDTAVVWYPDNVMRFEMWFSYAGNVTDPDNMTLYVYDPASNLYFNITAANANRTAPGLYHYKYAMPVSTSSGYYFAILTASKEGFVSQMVKPFRVAKGGPYDVRVKIIPPMEVPRRDYVNFEITLENMGEVTQDVYIDYWTSSGNQTFYYGGEAVLTPVGQNKTITRNAYIFDSQPIGMNTLNLKVTYDNVQAPIILNTTFEVIDESFNIPPPPGSNQTSQPPGGGGGGGGGGGSERIIYLPAKGGTQTGVAEITEERKLEISSYNKEINIVRGWSALESVKAKNAGKNPLSNITLKITGIPSLWYKATPANYETLMPGNETIFLIEFKIPSNADSGSYGLTFSANSKESADEKVGRLIVFTSIEELINHDLMSLKIEIEKLEEDTDYSEKIGKDATQVRAIISQARSQIALAEDNAKKKLFDGALQNTQTASGLVKRGKKLLESLQAVSASAAVPVQSPWVFGLKALLIIMLMATIALWSLKSRGKLKMDSLKAYLKRPEKGANEERKKELSDEKARIERMTKLLDSELKEGIITQNAYSELKKRNDEKLARIESEIKKM